MRVESSILERALAHDGARRAGKPSALSFDRRDAIRVSSEFEASPEEVFDAWLDPEIAGRWLFATATRPAAKVAIVARVGGAFHFVEGTGGGRFEHAGVYLAIDRPRRLVFTLAGDERSRDLMQVSVEIAPLDPGCVLTLAHENVPPDRASRIEARWTGMLYGLREILDP
jgi:uncharacterized protein YndB with AHSA1/START domain